MCTSLFSLLLLSCVIITMWVSVRNDEYLSGCLLHHPLPVISKEAVRQFLEHFICHFRSRIWPESFKQGHMKQINPIKKNKKNSVFYHIYVLQCNCVSFRSADGGNWTISCVLRTCPFTYCNENHFCYICWLHSLDMTLFEWFWWYLWPKVVFKTFQEFPTVSLNIAIPPPPTPPLFLLHCWHHVIRSSHF